MPFRCPLCLAPLDDKARLVRFCKTHTDVECIDCVSDDETARRIWCPADSCKANLMPGGGVYLTHVGCDAIFPIPENMLGLEVDEQLEISGRLSRHWVVGMLKDVKRRRTDLVKELTDKQAGVWEDGLTGMWFPPSLLAPEPTARLAFTRTVALAGPKEAGKTVLTMRAIEEASYGMHRGSLALNLRDFIYVRPKEGGSADGVPPIADALYLRKVMRLGQYFPLAGTKPSERPIIAAFFDAARNGSAVPEPKKKRFSFIRRLASAGRAAPLPTSSTSSRQREPSVVRPWHSVTFYDVSGESTEKGDEYYAQVIDSVSKVALVLDAGDIFRPNDAGAVKRLDDIVLMLAQLVPHRRPGLVLTKLDTCVECIHEETYKKLSVAANSLAADPRALATSTLKDWLPNTRSVCRKLARHLDDVDVLFVWTEGLDNQLSAETVAGQIEPSRLGGTGTGETLSAAEPRTFGMAHFIAWCFDARCTESGFVFDRHA